MDTFTLYQYSQVYVLCFMVSAWSIAMAVSLSVSRSLGLSFAVSHPPWIP